METRRTDDRAAMINLVGRRFLNNGQNISLPRVSPISSLRSERTRNFRRSPMSNTSRTCLGIDVLVFTQESGVAQ